jgi:dTDP-glucose 4,6-dehydratase
MKNVLITGGNGFIGSNFITYMTNKHINVNFVNYDCNYYCSSTKNTEELNEKHNYNYYNKKLQDKDYLLEVMEKHQIDTIVHFAAQSHVDNSFFNSLQYTDDNIWGTHYLLESIRIYNKIELFIHISTDEVYGENENDDDIKTEKTLLCPTNPYAATKAAAEMLVNSYYYSFKIPVIIIRSNNIYGKKQYTEKVIPKFINQIINNQKITIQGDGSNKRSFLYINDVISAIEIILIKGKIGNIYNISSADEITIIDLAKKLLSLMKNINNDNNDNYDYNEQITFIEDRKYNDKRYYICDKKLKELGWTKTTDLTDGLKETIDWYKNNKDYWI